MTEKDIKTLINTEIKKFVVDNLDKEVAKIMHDKSKTRAEMIDMVRNAFDSVFRTLWQKKDFWSTSIK